MFTRIDHVMICVPDLTQGIEQYRKLGFNIYEGGVHTGKGTHNAIGRRFPPSEVRPSIP